MGAEHVIARDIVTWMSAMGMWPMDGARRDEVRKKRWNHAMGAWGKNIQVRRVRLKSSYSASSCTAVCRGNMILEIHQ